MATHPDESRPTIVFVHGAWADATGFDAEIRALQRFMAERANATIVEVSASHVSFVSQPDAATQLILQAVKATMPTAGHA